MHGTALPAEPAKSTGIPCSAGIGLRHRHVVDFLCSRPRASWIEVHSETYLAAGGPRVKALETIRRDIPLSCHGVGLSLGSADGVDIDHLRRLKTLYDRLEPDLVSEHLAWSVQEGVYLNDLLPLPYTDASLRMVSDNIDRVQGALRRRILVENPSRYFDLADSVIPEWAFMAELPRRTGCGILLDVNNIHVSAHNLGFDPVPYLNAIPAEHVGEIHLAGHLVHPIRDQTLLIDDHGDTVADPVWRLYRLALERIGPAPSLIEWDTRVPELFVLLAEAAKAQALIEESAPASRSDGAERDFQHA